LASDATPREDLHEKADRVHAVTRSSDRSFGLVFAGVFVVIGLWPLLRGGVVRPWALGLALALTLLAALRPATLGPGKRLWFWLGMRLHAVVSPLVLAFLYYVTITPVGLLMRRMGKDPLRLKRDPDAPSYWIERHPPGPSPETMRNQF